MITEKKSKKTKKIKGVKAKTVKEPAGNVSPNNAGGEKEENKKEKKEKYFAAIGRRKTAIAQVRLYFSKKDKADFVVNEIPFDKYFSTVEQQIIVQQPLKLTKNLDKFRISVKVRGSGLNAQAEAIRHGIARVLVVWRSDLKKKLKQAGFLKRDPRKVERKKAGLKKARRAPQWRKR